MEQFLRQLQTIPEAAELIRRVEEGGCPAAVSGLQPVQRACVGAAVAAACGRPAVFLCGDEREVQVLSADLETLTGRRPVTLLGREWQFRPGAVGSRDWERSRLAALYALAQGDAPVVVATADGLMARTLPPETLRSLAITLEVGGQAELGALAEQLLSAGYTRCEQVEGVGQFALRGGILDVFSPLMDQPVRCEFFDDEIDSMGAFDPGTQRRTRNVSSARILPAAEVLPHCAPGGLPGLADQLTALAEKLAKKQKTEAIVQTLREDAERLRSGAAPGAADRYLAAIYPTVTAGVHYLPPDAVVFLSESGRVDERVKNTVLQQKQDVEALLSAGVLAGEYAHLTLTAEELYAALEDFPVILEDSLPTSRHPLRPRGLLTMNAKQLSSYGGSLETAVTDLEHYRSSGSAVLVLCGGETRAKNLHRLLEEKGIPATLDLSGAAMPAAGEVRLSLGALSAGSEWPALKLAVLTEGQLTAPAMRKRQRVKKDSNRQKLQSYTDLSPGDLVVHEHHGVGRFVGIQRMPVDGVEKDYIKIDYAGGDCLYVPVTQLDLVSKYIGGGEDAAETKKLSRLGGTDWEKAKSKAKKAVKDLAKGAYNSCVAIADGNWGQLILEAESAAMMLGTNGDGLTNGINGILLGWAGELVSQKNAEAAKNSAAGLLTVYQTVSNQVYETLYKGDTPHWPGTDECLTLATTFVEAMMGLQGDGEQAPSWIKLPAAGSAEEAKEAFRRLTRESEGEYAIIYVEENLARDLEHEIARYKDVPSPAIIFIPGREGPLGLGQAALKAAVEKAVGTDIL